MPKRLTAIPEEACNVWTMHALSADEAVRIGLYFGLAVAIFAAAIAVLVCIWLMPRSAKQ